MPVTQKQLANLRPCKPGETHNPNGRPKKKETIAQILERFGNLAISKNKTILGLVTDDIPPDLLKTARTLKQLALLKQVLRASAGDLKSLEYISDRVEGKAVQTVATMDVSPKPLFDDEDENAPFGFNPSIQLPDAIGEVVEEPKKEEPKEEPSKSPQALPPVSPAEPLPTPATEIPLSPREARKAKRLQRLILRKGK